ncbi:MAG: ATP-binding protein [Actinomycetota bacterium]
MTAPPPVGQVLGTDDATPLEYWVALADDQYLQLDDVVVCEREVPGRDAPVRMSGVVTQVRARHEGVRFDSDVFLVSDGVLPASVVEAAQVMTTRVEPEVFVPPWPGAEVRRATGAERELALYFDQMTHRLPIGLGRDGLPLFANLEFLDGTRGAHVNISGISGVATKTTYATFLLYGVFHSGVLGAEARNTKALIFNVKGEDLLFLDHPNAGLTTRDSDKYRMLGLVPGPFEDLAVYAPPRRDDPNATPDVETRLLGVDPFFWTLEEFATEELLPFVFADAEDERQQYTMVLHNVSAALKLGASTGGDGEWRVDSVTLRTYRDLVDLVVARVSDDMTRNAWAGPAIGTGTINAFVRRLVSSQRSLGRLVRADVSRPVKHRIETADAQVTVVDLHKLDDRAKRFVVGVTLRRAFDDKERSGLARPLLFVVLDELNKYAPRDGESPIKEILLDVAERGRSLGIVLIGAQQTASEVERRIISNSAIRVVGRLDPAEAARPEYGFLPTAHQQRAVIAKPGTMFVTQPEIPVPLVVEFPFPSWATRPSERGANPAEGGVLTPPDDPLEGVPSGPRDH